MKKPDIFAYLDYRKFLADAFAGLKAENPKASYRSFAKDAGYTSPNLLQLIIEGKRKLAQDQIPGTIRGLGLNKQQADFFTHLVGFDQAKGFEDKNFYYQKIVRSRRYADAKPIEKGQFEYFDQWYNPAVRELLTHKDFTGDLNWIARRIHPRVTLSQVEKSVELLQALGLIRREGNGGRFVQTDSIISTPAEVASLAVANYHRSVLKLASEAIEDFSQGQRDLRSVTLGIPKSAYPALKGKLENFWSDLLALSEAHSEVEEVLQINLQLFPLTKVKGE